MNIFPPGLWWLVFILVFAGFLVLGDGVRELREWWSERQ